ncbi:DUF4921 family protein [Candidatus Woesearchaeota archaeon]|nr:DUF4921 family protein [Candidatus Woesearchaeota archaeon]
MELRKDYILDRYVFCAAGRASRPREYKKGASADAKVCFFCSGNESMTPDEIGRLPSRNGKGWSVRWFFNKFPAAEEKGSPDVRTDNTFFTFADAYGRHEIIAETPNHSEQLWDFGRAGVADVLKVYADRIRGISGIPGIRYVAVFKNHGLEAGASLAHSHSQLIGMAVYPPAVAEEVMACRRFGSCPYCRIIEVEKKGVRLCFENGSFVSFAPYASRFHYEAWVFPKRHARSLATLSGQELDDLADILLKVLGRLKSIGAPYNLVLHYSGSDDLHMHFEVTPRLSVWAGFEFATGCVINSVLPEDAAAFYRNGQGDGL